MKNKNILYGLLGVGAIAGLYFWNKNKKSDTNMPQIMPSEFILNKLNCPNGTKKISVNCIKAPCPDLEVCA